MEIIRKVRPNIVMTLDAWLPYEIHPDHRVTGLMASEATVFAGMPNFYREQILSGIQPHKPDTILLFATSNPNLFVDIAKLIEKKAEAIIRHESQLPLSFPEGFGKGGLKKVRRELVKSLRKRSRKGGRHIEAMRMFKVGAGHFIRE